MQFYSQKIEAINDVKAKIYAQAKFNGITLNNSQCQTRANRVVSIAADDAIRKITDNISLLPQTIEVIEELKITGLNSGK